MPIDTVQHFMHVTTRKNKQVMHNVARLWTIGQQATSDQDILDALHPWNDNKESISFFLRFSILLRISLLFWQATLLIAKKHKAQTKTNFNLFINKMINIY